MIHFRANPLTASSGLLVSILAAAMLAAGCEAPPTPARAEPVKQEATRRLGPQVQRVKHEVFSLPEICPVGYPEVAVRLTRKADLPITPFPSNFIRGAGSGAGLAAVGVCATMLYPMAQGAAVGGIILGPSLLIMGIVNETHAKAIKSAIEDTDLPARLQSATQSRLKRELGGELRTNCRVEVMISHYGFIDDGYTGQVVFALDAEIRVITMEKRVFEDQLLLGPFHRSDDVPPPHRATFDEFGRDRGGLARRILEEQAEIIAAVIAARLGGKG